MIAASTLVLPIAGLQRWKVHFHGNARRKVAGRRVSQRDLREVAQAAAISFRQREIRRERGVRRDEANLARVSAIDAVDAYRRLETRRNPGCESLRARRSAHTAHRRQASRPRSRSVADARRAHRAAPRCGPNAARVPRASPPRSPEPAARRRSRRRPRELVRAPPKSCLRQARSGALRLPWIPRRRARAAHKPDRAAKGSRAAVRAGPARGRTRAVERQDSRAHPRRAPVLRECARAAGPRTSSAKRCSARSRAARACASCASKTDASSRTRSCPSATASPSVTAISTIGSLDSATSSIRSRSSVPTAGSGPVSRAQPAARMSSENAIGKSAQLTHPCGLLRPEPQLRGRTVPRCARSGVPRTSHPTADRTRGA